MNAPNLVDEIVSLDAMRVQKVFGLFNSILVMELYSPIHKRLYFVLDQNPATRTMHLQQNRPQGFKTKSMLITLLDKYAVNRNLRFYKLDEDGFVVKACFTSDDVDYCLIFESFPRVAVGLFAGSELIASLKKGVSPDFRRGFLQHLQRNLSLKQNLLEAQNHEKRLLDYHRKSLFEHRLASLHRDIVKKATLLLNVQSDLKKCQNHLLLLKDAEVLKQNLYLLKRGMTHIELVDYETEPPTKRTILLDPGLSPQAFLDKTFTKIKRAKRGIVTITNRLAVIEAEVDLAKARLAKLKEDSASSITLNDIVLRLDASVKEQKKSEVRLPYRTYLSSDNIKILVGRSAKDSDDLTLHYARGNNWWFHSNDVAGAHVVVKSAADSLPENTMLEAAMLAIHFSKAKSEAHAVVQYTRAKNIRKPKGMAPGRVLVSQIKTIDITMDTQILGSLLAREDKAKPAHLTN